ncbi:hypothetical protein [Streptomyces sp. NBC_01614]|uniref:hypothetical protein n=1 Tax=Streptomyces sp. NBC_01614 TaxID=2975897 RepID=UPI00386E9401
MDNAEGIAAAIREVAEAGQTDSSYVLSVRAWVTDFIGRDFGLVFKDGKVVEGAAQILEPLLGALRGLGVGDGLQAMSVFERLCAAAEQDTAMGRHAPGVKAERTPDVQAGASAIADAVCAIVGAEAVDAEYVLAMKTWVSNVLLDSFKLTFEDAFTVAGMPAGLAIAPLLLAEIEARGATDPQQTVSDFSLLCAFAADAPVIAEAVCATVDAEAVDAEYALAMKTWVSNVLLDSFKLTFEDTFTVAGMPAGLAIAPLLLAEIEARGATDPQQTLIEFASRCALSGQDMGTHDIIAAPNDAQMPQAATISMISDLLGNSEAFAAAGPLLAQFSEFFADSDAPLVQMPDIAPESLTDTRLLSELFESKEEFEETLPQLAKLAQYGDKPEKFLEEMFGITPNVLDLLAEMENGDG